MNTNQTFQTDIVLTEREFEDADVAELRAQLEEAERYAEEQRAAFEWEQDMLRATSEWNYR